MSLTNKLAANAGQYVFALYNERDGIQINHFATAGTNIEPTTYTTVGGGSNNPTSAPSAYSSTNWCGGSNLKLNGTTDASALS